MRRGSSIVACALCAACATSESTRSPYPSHARPPVDFASEFVREACVAPTPETFRAAWEEHEKRHWPVYQPLYYATPEAEAERAALLDELVPQQREVCNMARAFTLLAPGLVDELRNRVALLMARPPEGDVYFTVALPWTDGRSDAVDGKNAIALNARHDSFLSTTALVATVAHELIHDAQRENEDDREVGPVALQLWREGAAVYGVSLLLPELGDRALGMKDEERARIPFVRASAAAAFLPLLAPSADPAALDRFFRGGQLDPIFPPRMGYALGLELYKRIAAASSPSDALNLDARTFISLAEPLLDLMSKEAPPGAKSG